MPDKPITENPPPVEYDAVQRSMSVRHVSMNADGTFTMAYEEGAMDPKAKAEAHPTPWRWDSMPGSIVATTALLDATGKPVLKAFSNPLIPLLAFIHVEPAARPAIESAGEMEALLRRLVDLSKDGDAIRDNVGWICDIAEDGAALLARLDAAKARG